MLHSKRGPRTTAREQPSLCETRESLHSTEDPAQPKIKINAIVFLKKRECSVQLILLWSLQRAGGTDSLLLTFHLQTVRQSISVVLGHCSSCPGKLSEVKVTQSCLTLCDPMDYTVHGILQARILEWVAFPFSKGSSQPKDPNPGIFPTQGWNSGLLHCGPILYQLSHKGSPRILERVAYSFSSGSSWPRNQTRVSCIAGGFFTTWAFRECSGQILIQEGGTRLPTKGESPFLILTSVIFWNKNSSREFFSLFALEALCMSA